VSDQLADVDAEIEVLGACLLQAALAYAQRGWYVFPVRAGGKVPLVKRWPEVATTDADIIAGWWARWPDANIGIATGASDLLVIDVDDEHGVAVIESATGQEFPDTLEALTGRGGRHLYYRRHGAHVKNRVNIAAGIDVRAVGGYVVAPPSVHESGVEYAWDGEPDDEVSDALPWLLGLCGVGPDVRQAKDAKPPVKVAVDGGSAYGRAGLAGEVERVLGAPEGERNHTLNRAAYAVGQLVAGGELEHGAAVDALADAAAQSGLADAEARKTIASGMGAGQMQPREAPVRPGHVFERGDECELAEYWLSRLEDDCGAVVADMGSLWGYDAGAWEPWDDHELRCLVGRAAGWSVKAPRKGEPDRVAPMKMGKNARANAVDIMLDERTQRRFFDAGEPAVVFADVTVTLDASGGIRTGPHRREHRATVRYPFDLSRALCPRWLEALATWFEGAADADQRIAVLQEFAGAALFGIAPRYQRAMVLVGEGGNGKSQALKVIEGMFPRAATCQVTPQQIGGRSSEYYLAHLVGKRLNVVSDMPAAKIIEAGEWKAIVAGESVMARQPAGRTFTLTPRAGHLFSANQLPGTRDQTDGFWRRWVVVPFERVIPIAERVPNFAEGILDAELPGIAAWAIDGAARLTMRRGGYTLPASHEAALHEWRIDADSVAEWVQERCVSAVDAWTATQALYATFAEWSRANGRQAMSSIHFGRRLRQLGYVKSQRKGRNGYPISAAVN